jgi:acyl-CoA reductase-like NAD-dependent aldehyde dehydrogenase
MSAVLRTISPVDGRVYVERVFGTAASIETALAAATRAQIQWRRWPLADRCAVLRGAVSGLVGKSDLIAAELSWQMGRPISHGPGEIRGFQERASYMLEVAEEALAPLLPQAEEGFHREIRRVPLGLVVVIAPWNYPYLTAVNAIWPALIAGNAVVLKHSPQTPLCAERLAQALSVAGLPRDVFQFLHLSHADTSRLIRDGRVSHVCFTGSVAGGHAVVQSLQDGFATAGLELGGKDPAYVCEDADLDHAIATLVDGAFFNAGQSCCGVKRIYVRRQVYERFVAGFAELTRQYRLGSPVDPATTLGPVVRADAATAIRSQVRGAVALGARALIDPAEFPMDEPGTAYVMPQVLVNVDHSMPIMHEETFGPTVAIMTVQSDDEAIHWMNDSEFGLTASVFSADAERALQIGERLDTGTVFLNRCDYLDPRLAWTGVKQSGRGCTLSKLGFEQLTRPKSFHFKVMP